MTQHWFEDLKFSVEVFDEGGNLKEVLARLHDLDAARAVDCAKRVATCWSGSLLHSPFLRAHTMTATTRATTGSISRT